MRNHSTNLKHYSTGCRRLAAPLIAAVALALLLATFWLAAPAYAIGIASFPGGNGKIAFVSYRDGNNEIYVMDNDGANQTRLTNNAADDKEPAWSPDGSKIAFVSNRSGNFDIYVMDADGSNLIQLTTNSQNEYRPAWSPDGTKIAFFRGTLRGEDIYTISPDGSGTETKLTNAPTDGSAVIHYLDPAWSPDGSKIAVIKDKLYPAPTYAELYVMNADGTGETQLTNSPGQLNHAPNWSPDGSRLIFTREDCPIEVTRRLKSIYTIDADGQNENRTNACSPGVYGYEDPVWAPDGSGSILYGFIGASNTAAIFLDGNGLTTAGQRNFDPDWQPLQAGTIIIEKRTAPAGLFDFGFVLTTTTGLTTTFALSDTDRYTLTNVTAGAYTVTEDDPGFGTRLSDLRCDDPNSATPSTTNLAARTAAINLDAGETVTCRFTNTADDIVIIEKVTYPAGGSGFDFTNTITGPFSLDDGDFTVLDVPALGTHTITETDPGPAWDVSAIDCAILAPTGVITPVSGNLQTGAVDLPLNQPGELAFCLYENTQRSTITITKQAAPADNTNFNFSGDLGSFSLQDPANSSKVFTQVVPGVYTITETAGTGWRLDQVLCRSTNGATSYKSNENQGQLVVDLAAGDDVTCDFISIIPPKLTVVKQTSGGDGTFEFTALGPISPTFSLTTQSGSGQQVFSSLYSSTYAITETVPAGWQQTGATCSNNSTPDNFSLSAGDVVTCTFVNEPTPFCQASSWAVSNQTELNDAIACYNAKNVAGSYAITVTQDITLTASSRAINNTTPGAVLTIAGNYNAVDGQDISGVRVFNILTDTNVILNELTVTGGNLDQAGEYGGGIENRGTLTVTHSAVSGNSTGDDGGGISNWGTLTISNSTISDNHAPQTGGDGGGIYNHTDGALYIYNSTVAGNTAKGNGGGIRAGGLSVLDSVTIAGNTAENRGGGLYLHFSLAGTTISNSIMGDNSVRDCYKWFGDLTDGGHNLVEDQELCGFTDGVNGNIVGQSPLIGPLADNGGPTWSRVPLAGSPVIDKGSTTLTTDQRGIARPYGAKDDIGAVEATCYADSWPVGSEAELDVAIACYNAKTAPNSYVITFTQNINLTDITRPIANTNSGVQLVLEGGNHTLDGQGLAEVRPLTIQPDTDVTINHLTVTGGNMTSADEYGGGIHVAGNLTLNDSTVTGNTVAASGGGIYVRDVGMLTVNRSTVSGNTAGVEGGGLFNDGVLAISNSAISGNTAPNSSGGGLVNSGAGGLTLHNSTISGNSAGQHGGGLVLGGSATLDSVTVANNTSVSFGAGVYPKGVGVITMTNSILADNTSTDYSAGSGAVDCGSIGGNHTWAQSHNLVEDGDTCRITAAGVNNTIEGVDPQLGPLADNGGSTLTHAPLDGSPVVDAGSTTLTVDQRGVTRPFDVNDDIGAVESFLCAGDNWSVSTEAELDRAITCFNTKTLAATHVITLTRDIDLTASTPAINNITATLVITGDGYWVDGNDIAGVRPFEIAANTTVTMNNLTVTGGNASGSGGSEGGGIENYGTLNLSDATISGNTAGLHGGGLSNRGSMTIDRSTISGNSAASEGGGVINHSGNTLTIRNSTLSGNSAASGGGVHVFGTTTIDSVTFSGNTGSSAGGALYVNGSTTVRNSILANSNGSVDCFNAGGTLTDGGHNLVETPGTCTFSAGTSITGSDPLLGPLANNGGGTKTHALLGGSPAIDAGDTTFTVDQRGVTRPQDGTDDIGAYESRCGTATAWTAGSEFELDTAIGCFNKQTVAGSYTITVTQNISLTGNIAHINNPTSGPGLVIVGGSHTIDGGHNPPANVGEKCFDIQSPTPVTISDLTMIRCHSLLTGGAIHNTGGGALTLNNMTLTDNVAGGGGAAINSTGPVTVTNSTISNNDQPGTFGFYGGAILIQSPGSLRLIDSVVSSNKSVFPGAGIYATSGTSLTIEGSLISSNIADETGGGIYNEGTLTISNSTVFSNTAAVEGGGLFNDGVLAINNSTISGNTAPNSSGGGLVNSGAGGLTLHNSTISGNSAGQHGGGLVLGGSATLDSVTVANNTSVSFGAGVYPKGFGVITMTNSILADNTSTDYSAGSGAVDCGSIGGGHTWAQSYNLVEDGDTCRITADGVNNTIEGVDPQLGPLADNGGSTQTHALLPGSPALDAGATTLTTDQRGEPRPFGLADDIGAYESQANGTIVIAKQTAPANQGEFDFTHNITATTAFTLAGGQSKTFLNVAPGTYTVTEAIEVAWRLVDLRCDDAASARPSSGVVGTRTATIEVEPGETVTCTFTNTKLGTIYIGKTTIPATISPSFEFTQTIDPANGVFQLNHGGSSTFQDVAPGQYIVTEINVPAGWQLSDLTCNDGGSATPSTVDRATRTATINVEPGESVGCYFTNTKLGTIYIGKTTIPATISPSFEFTQTIDPANGAFQLNHGGSSTFLDVAPGQYIVTEINVPAGWQLSDLTCNDGGSATPSTVDRTTRTATINVEPGESVGCYFENTQLGTIFIGKTTLPATISPSFEFTQTIDPANGAFQINHGGSSTFQDVAPGQYIVTEINVPAGWQLSDLTCSDGGSATPSTVDRATRTATINVEPGESVGCYFENTQLGTIYIGKTTIPATISPSFEFTQTIDPANGAFQLNHGGSSTFLDVAPGQYIVTEINVPAGWQLSDLTCNDGSSTTPSTVDRATRTATINVDPGESVGCTFENTQLGAIIVVKRAVGGDASFPFTSTIPGQANFSLTTVNGVTQTQFSNLPPGRYSISETIPADWTLLPVKCNGDDPRSIDVDPGETVVCVFINLKQDTIVVEKRSVGGDGRFDFVTNIPSHASFALTTTNGIASRSLTNLTPATYNIGEIVPPGWKLTAATCSNGNPPSAVSLAPDQTVTCIFTNTSSSTTITIVKDSAPDSPTNFRFTGSYLGGGGGSDSQASINDFYLDDPGANMNDGDAYTNSKSFKVSTGARYSFKEPQVSGWHLAAIDCTPAGSATVNLATFSVAVDTSSGVDVTCTFRNEKAAALTVRKYRESNGRIGQQAPEPFLGAWSIQVKNSNGAVVAQAATNALGKASFSLKPGVYTVCELQKSGWTQKVPNPTVNPCYALTLAPASATQVDFGNCPNSSCPATVASEDGTETPAAPVLFAVPEDALDGWVEQWLLTPDGPTEETLEPDQGEEGELTQRLFLPVVLK